MRSPRTPRRASRDHAALTAADAPVGPPPEPARAPARIGLYLDATFVGGAERSALHVAAAYDGPARLVVCATSPDVLADAAGAVPDAELVEVRRRDGRIADFAAHRRLFWSLHLDLLQVTLPNPFAARPAILAACSLGLPTVTVEQLVLPSRRRRGRMLKRILSAPLDGQVVVGHASARRLHEHYGIPMRAISVIHNGIPDILVDPVAIVRRPVVGCAARLADQKQLDVLIDAMTRLPGVDLLLVGDGARRQELEARAAAAGVDARTTFVGWVPDARPWVAALDVFVLPSRDEAFPLTIVEAMLSGVPVVASDVGSVAEAVHDGVTGLLVPSGDVCALADAVARVLVDDDLRRRLVAAAGQLARQQFTADVMAASYSRLWQDVLAGRAGGRRWVRPSRRWRQNRDRGRRRPARAS